MRIDIFVRNPRLRDSPFHKAQAWPVLILFLICCPDVLRAQTTNQDSVSEQIQKLTNAIASTEAQLEQSQRQIGEMQKQLQKLQQQVAGTGSGGTIASPSGSTPSAAVAQRPPEDTAPELQDIRDQQAMQQSQIVTQEQTKVESESKFPVKVTGLLLLNGFVNTSAVDVPSTPTLAVTGSGSTGASVRQTVLGFDARGPHLLGAHSFADLRVDFDGAPQSSAGTSTYSGPYSASSMLLRLRTAHAGLQWEHTEAYFSLDHPVFNPDTPTSLTAIAEPALAWSGNLWTWNPQIGVRQEIALASARDLQLEAAMVDVGDPPLSSIIYPAGKVNGTPPSSAEQSRWPGAEAHLSLVGSGSNAENGNHFGIGGYFAPHRIPTVKEFDSWAATLDSRLLLPAHLEFTGSFYRGLALGGLGGGAFKDFEYRTDPDTGAYYVHPLDDAGGWAQLKERINERIELNAAFGMDNAFAREVRRDSVPGGTLYQNLARIQTYTGNVIYKPSAYLLFSLEYRHLESLPELSSPAASNVIGLGAGFKF
jgi:hypothetical protein